MFPEQELFSEEEFFAKDNSEKDDTKIVYTPLYFSEEELKEFKKLCKEGMRKEYPAQQLNSKANVSDLLLIILRKNYGSQADNSATHNQ